jgi:shikimate kinase
MTTFNGTDIDVQDRPHWPQIVLTGFMGAGKSTLGALLAEHLGVPFHDSDSLIEAATGRRIADLFTHEGEARFRDLEHQAIASVATQPCTVLALGGGSLMHPGTRQLLCSTYMIYLEITAETARARITNPADRPLARSAQLDELLALREPIYRSTASLILEAHDELPTVTLARVLAELPASFDRP